MPVATLNNFREHRDPVVMGKIAYVVDSRAEWIADAKGATDCTANGAAADYLKITSTVSAKNIPLKPIVRHEHRHPGARHLHERRGQPRGGGRRRRRHGPRRRQRLDQRPRQRRPAHRRQRLRLLRLRAGRGLQRHRRRARATSTPNGNANATGTSSVGSQKVATLSLTYDQAGQATVNFATDPDDRPEIDSFQGSVGLLATPA